MGGLTDDFQLLESASGYILLQEIDMIFLFLHDRTHYVTNADHPDNLAVFQHRQVADKLAGEQLHAIINIHFR